MNKNIILYGIALVGIVGISYAGYNYGLKENTKSITKVDNSIEIIKTENILQGKEITFYKSPTCGCCGGYEDALRERGAIVNTISSAMENTKIKKDYNIPAEKQSCHTFIVDGYVAEGHIPVDTLEKFLAEKPDAKGIVLPGMPIGTPGMPGKKREIYKIDLMTHNNEFKEYAYY